MRTLFHRSCCMLAVPLLLGCTPPQVTPTATTEPSSIPDTPQPTVIHTPEPNPLPTDQPQPTNLPTATPDVPLAENGPWFIFEAGEVQYVYNLWAMNLDGTGLTKLPINSWEHYGVHPDFDPQTGGIIAYVDGDMFQDPTLKLLYLPSGESETITPLTSEATAYPLTPPPDQTGEIDHFQIARAITDYFSSPSWSPDGRSLAFVGAMNGTSADIYVYSMDTGEITQVTSGPTQVQYLLWSPDGKYILHLGINSFGTGVGDNADSIWAARSDGSGSIRLVDYPEDDIYDASPFGWMSNDVVLVSDQQAAQNNNLRLINITTGEEEIMWDHSFYTVSIDWETKTVMVIPSSDDTTGLWMYRPDSPPQQITNGIMDISVPWLPGAGVFCTQTIEGGNRGFLVIDLNGNTTFVPAPNKLRNWRIESSPDGQNWAWVGSTYMDESGSLCIGHHSETPECIFDERAKWVRWLPDGTGMFVATEKAIYYTPYPDIDFQLIVSDLYIGFDAWFLSDN